MRPIVPLVVLVFALGSCASAGSSSRANQSTPTTVSTSTSSDQEAALAQVRTVIALGDSVPYGTACHCAPYPSLSGADIERVAKHSVEVANDAVPGYKSGSVAQQLSDDEGVIAHVQRSQLALVEIGANDVAYSTRCGTTVSCYDERLPAITENLTAIVHRLHELARTNRLMVVLLDYWNVWLGGRYAREQGAAYVTAADTVTDEVDTAIESVARSTGSVYVDLRAAFRGPDYTWDETHLLAPDGDHPNADGHQRIAQAIAQAVGTE